MNYTQQVISVVSIATLLVIIIIILTTIGGLLEEIRAHLRRNG